MVLCVPDNNPSGLYDSDKYELGHKFHRIRNGHMSTLSHITYDNNQIHPFCIANSPCNL